jgi:hypothetical protein
MGKVHERPFTIARNLVRWVPMHRMTFVFRSLILVEQVISKEVTYYGFQKSRKIGMAENDECETKCATIKGKTTMKRFETNSSLSSSTTKYEK